MNNKTLLSTSLIILIVLSAISCGRHKKDYILNEDFDSNKLGWCEEFTAAHTTEIKDGFLYIKSDDTSRQQTSNGPLNRSFLYDFPKNYEITSSIQSLGQFVPKHYYGIILISGSLTYKFEISDSSNATIMATEYDENKDAETYLISKTWEDFGTDSLPVNFKVDVKDRAFEFYINDQLIGTGKLKTKNFVDVRLFTTSGSSVKVDYLRIKKVE
jgi:hypothetical protein